MTAQGLKHNPCHSGTSRHSRTARHSRESGNPVTDNLDIWSSVYVKKATTGRGRNGKISPYGIQKLRELILELAVRGKLTPQDPNDEPASVLLEKTAEEKARLVKEGKIKRQNRLPDISESEIPFNLPSGWEWVRADRFSQKITDGEHFRPKTQDKGVYFLSAKDIREDGVSLDDPLYVSEEIAEKALQRCDPERGDILIVSRGATVGRMCTVNIDDAFCLLGSVILIKPVNPILSDYLKIVMKSPHSFDQLVSASGSTAQPAIYLRDLKKIAFPIAPFAEQHRIVAKVDELMAICDQLEQQQTDSITAHQTLVETLLGALTTASDQKDFEQTWQRIAEHFDTLFTTEHSIDQLKQTILQLAVMGKLVPQDPSNEPASVLLEKITEEKAQLIKERKIKEQKALPKICKDEKPFLLPKGWEWIRFGELGCVVGGGTPNKANPDFWNGEIPWVSPKDMKVSHIVNTQDYVTQLAIENSSVKLIPENSLLVVVRGMILAHSFPVAANLVPVTINQDMKALLILPEIREYLLTVIQGLKNNFVSMVDRSSHGTCKLVSEKLWSKLIAVPSLAEQHRIVAKVDELMTLCDALKARIQDAQTTQTQLADAIVEQAVA